MSSAPPAPIVTTTPLAARTGLRAAVPLLVAGFCIQFAVVGGGIDTVSVFLNALSEAEGWSRRTLSIGIAVGALGAGLATPLVGLAIDRFGVRVPMTVGVGLLAGGFAVLARMDQAWHFVAANVLLGPGFAAAAMLPITVAVAVSVPQRTATALGIVSMGASAGALVMAPLLQAAIDAAGWRNAYWLMAALVLLTPIPCLLFALPRGTLRQGGGLLPPRLDVLRELRRPGVPALCGVIVLPGLVGFGVNVHMVPLLTDAGHAAGFAAGVLGAAVGASALGKLAGGFLGDRIGAIATLRLALLSNLIAAGLLAMAGSKPAIGFFVAAHGLAIGAQIAVVPVIALTIFGSERFATLYGLLSLASALAIGLAPVVPGVIREAAGSYAGAIVFWCVAMALALGVAFMLRERPGPAPASDHA